MSKERLEQIKDAIAYELGLTDDWMDGTYLYYLMRSKSAFAVGTMTLDDFKEIDEELLDEIFNAIEPFFIEQAERVQELEIQLSINTNNMKQLQKERDEWKDTAKSYYMTNQELREQNRRYREALEEVLKTDDYEDPQDYIDRIVTKACQALEGEE